MTPSSDCMTSITAIGQRPLGDANEEKVFPRRQLFEISSDQGFGDSVYKTREFY